MKNSLLIALLGLTVSVVTPSIAAADDFKFGPNKSYKNDQNRGHNNRHAKKHVAKQHNQKRRVHKAKPPKLPHQRIIAKLDNKIHNRHNRRHDNKRRQVNNYDNNHANNHRNKRRHNKSKPSFSITWNSNTPNVNYDNGYYGYNNDQYYNDTPRYASSIYERQNRQQRRIHKGRKSGQLVRREVKRLRQEQRQIQHKIAHYKRDGRLNRHEKSRIHQMQDVASNNIRNKRNNRLTRWSKSRGNNYEYAWY